MKSLAPSQWINVILGIIAVILGILATSQVIPPTWIPYITLALSIDTALQRFLPAALGPAAGVADPHGGAPPTV